MAAARWVKRWNSGHRVQAEGSSLGGNIYQICLVVARKVEVVCNAKVILGLLYPNLSDSLAVCFESGPTESSVN